jgi:hypothetical protein
MKKRVLLLQLILLLMMHTLSSAQKLTWNPVLKFDDSFHQTPVGTIENNYYLLTGNFPYVWGMFKDTGGGIGKSKLKLVKYNDKLDAVTEQYLSFRKEMAEFVDGYIDKGQIHIIYFNDDEALVKKVLDKNMNEIASYTSSVKDRRRKGGFGATALYQYARSEDSKYFAVCINKTVEVLDDQLKSIGLTQVDEGTDKIEPTWYKNKFYFAGHLDDAESKIVIYQYDVVSKATNKATEEIAGQWGARLFVNKADQKLHYFSLVPNKENIDKKGNVDVKLAERVYHATYSPTFTREKTEDISLEQYKERKTIGVMDARIKKGYYLGIKSYR